MVQSLVFLELWMLDTQHSKPGEVDQQRGKMPSLRTSQERTEWEARSAAICTIKWQEWYCFWVQQHDVLPHGATMSGRIKCVLHVESFVPYCLSWPLPPLSSNFIFSGFTHAKFLLDKNCHSNQQHTCVHTTFLSFFLWWSDELRQYATKDQATWQS